MRNKAIDTVGGVMILFMILRHCFIDTVKDSLFGGVIAYYPLLFFMAWFFFKGGMFYRDEPLAASISKGFTRLLVPYFVFSLIAVILASIVYGCLDGIQGIQGVFQRIPVYVKREGAVDCNAPLWFLLSFFLVRVFFTFARSLHIPSWCVSICALLAAFGLYRAQFPIGQYYGNTAMGLFCFSMGYLLKDLQYHKALFIPSTVIYVTYLVYCCCTRSVVGIFNSNVHTPFFPTALYYIAGCIFVNNLFTRVPKLQSDFLAGIGYDSMSYYVVHFPVIYLAWAVERAVFHMSDVATTFSLVILELALLPFLVKPLSHPKCLWMTGRGPLSSLVILKNQTIAYLLTASAIVFLSLYVIQYIIR